MSSKLTLLFSRKLSELEREALIEDIKLSLGVFSKQRKVGLINFEWEKEL